MPVDKIKIPVALKMPFDEIKIPVGVIKMPVDGIKMLVAFKDASWRNKNAS